MIDIHDIHPSRHADTAAFLFESVRIHYRKFVQAPIVGEAKILLKNVVESDVAIAAEIRNTMVGVCTAQYTKGDRGDRLYVSNLFVRPGMTGHGVGSMLLSRILQEARMDVELQTMLGNRRAIKFYRHHGGKSFRIVDGSWGRVIWFRWNRDSDNP